jgi:hypothetical protein
MMPNRFASSMMAAALCSAAAALAQPAAALAQPASAPAAKGAPAVAPVTVTAQGLPSRKVIEKQSSDFVQHFAGISNPEIDQIGRWHEAVCAQVEGLPPEQAAMVKARIESVAQAVGLPAAWAKGCRANVEIVFSDQPQAVMDVVARRREDLLGYYHVHDRDKLKTVSRPIQSWYTTATRVGATCGAADLAFATLKDAGGLAVRNTGFPGANTTSETVDDPESVAPVGCGDNSRFTALYTSVFHNVFIVADSKALQGKDLGLVADYLVMLALSKPRTLDGCYALPSVVDRFAPSACAVSHPPDGLTPADAAYLTALYASDGESRKNFEQSEITRRMAAILIKASAGATSLPALGAKGPRQAH